MSWIFFAIQCSNISSKTMANKCKVFYSNSFPPFFNSINKIIFCLFMSKILWVISDWRKSDTKSIKSMHLIMFFQMLKSSDVCQGSSPKTMKHDKMRQILLWMTVCIYLMHMILFIDPDVSSVQLMFKYKVRKSKSFFVDFVCLFRCDFIIINKELLLYSTICQSFNTYLHLQIYFIIFFTTFPWISLKFY